MRLPPRSALVPCPTLVRALNGAGAVVEHVGVEDQLGVVAGDQQLAGVVEQFGAGAVIVDMRGGAGGGGGSRRAGIGYRAVVDRGGVQVEDRVVGRDAADVDLNGAGAVVEHVGV